MGVRGQEAERDGDEVVGDCGEARVVGVGLRFATESIEAKSSKHTNF